MKATAKAEFTTFKQTDKTRNNRTRNVARGNVARVAKNTELRRENSYMMQYHWLVGLEGGTPDGCCPHRFEVSGT